jgi:cytochrome P450
MRPDQENSSKPVPPIVRPEMAANLTCQLRIKEQASWLLANLDTEWPIDLVSQFIHPWCLHSALAIACVDIRYSHYLATLVNESADTAERSDDCSINKGRQANEANSKLDLFFRTRNGQSSKSIFLGVAQTVPAFVASAWAALLDHTDQMSAMRRYPELVPQATEELLRYAGPVHTLFRQADKNIELSGQTICSGDRVILRVASANRDPEQFVEPNRLDIRREIAGHLALSAGPHSCPAGSVVRLMSRIAIECLLEVFSAIELSDSIVWSRGTTLMYPHRLPVVVQKAATCSVS